MIKGYITITKFTTWTEILTYLSRIKKDATDYAIQYKSEIYYSEIEDVYKVKITI